MEEGRQVAALEELGLTNYEARVYLALLRREAFTAAEAARQSGIPRQRVYDVLDALVRRQLAVSRPGRVVRYTAVEPQTAVAGLVEQRRRALTRLEELSAGLTEALRPTWAQGRRERDPLDYVEVLRDQAAIADRFTRIQRQARSELLCFAKPPYASRPTQNTAGLEAVARLRARGGTVRAVYSEVVLADPETREAVRHFAAAGEEARVHPDPPLKLVIADGALVLCEMPDPVAGGGATTSLVIEHAALAATLRLAFAAVWDTARPLDEALADPLPDGP